VSRDSIVIFRGLRSGDRIPVGRDFPHLSRLTPGPTQPPTQGEPGFFPGGKAVKLWH
jgi:hypothetical protein